MLFTTTGLLLMMVNLMNKIIIIFILTLSIIIVLFECKVCFGRDYSSWLDACKPYRQTVESILSNEGVSKDYYYLMVAESRCKPSAKSHAGARGFWQLMPHTARKYGCDNPDDLECATNAAAKYLKALESRFDTFQDVIAAWNMGGHNYQRYGKSSQALGLVYRVKAIRRSDR